jgi:DNA-binding response OmpR family regulator
MPGLDGFGVARQLRLDPRTRAAHIDCLTGRVDIEARQQALLAGCERYLTKPVDPTELLDVVHQQVAHSEPPWITGLGKAEAEELMDWLENHGCTNLEVDWRGEEGFALRCACPPGNRLGMGPEGHLRLVQG